MPNEATVHVLKRTPLVLERKRVIPSPGHLSMNCGNCGSTGFEIHVEPVDGTAQPVEVVCSGCKRVYKIDPATGMFQKSGKVTLNERKS